MGGQTDIHERFLFHTTREVLLRMVLQMRMRCIVGLATGVK
jgi:hypothetical protein